MMLINQLTNVSRQVLNGFFQQPASTVKLGLLVAVPGLAKSRLSQQAIPLPAAAVNQTIHTSKITPINVNTGQPLTPIKSAPESAKETLVAQQTQPWPPSKLLAQAVSCYEQSLAMDNGQQPLTADRTSAFIGQLQDIISQWQNRRPDYVVRDLVDQIIIQAEHGLSTLANQEQTTEKLANAAAQLNDVKQGWRQVRYSQPHASQELLDWVSMTSTMMSKKARHALAPLTGKYNKEAAISLPVVQQTTLGTLIQLKNQLAQLLTVGVEGFQQQYGSHRIALMQKQLAEFAIPLTIDDTAAFNGRVDDHPALSEIKLLLTLHQQSLSVSPAKRGTAKGLINNAAQVGERFKANIQEKQQSRIGQLFRPVKFRHKILQNNLAQELRQAKPSVKKADLLKEKAKLGGGLQRAHNTSTQLDQMAAAGEASQLPLAASLAPNALGLTEAVAGVTSSVIKTQEVLSKIRQLQSNQQAQLAAKDKIAQFLQQPVGRQQNSFPQLVAGLLDLNKGKLGKAGFYGLVVDSSDALFGALRYLTNTAVNGTRIVDTTVASATGASVTASAASALASASVASSSVALGLSTAKAVKAGINLHQQQTNARQLDDAVASSQLQASQRNGFNPTEAIEDFAYGMAKQRKVMPKAVDLAKETVSAAAYATSTGVGVAALATAGTVGVGVASATVAGAAAAAVAATTALGAVAYHQGRQWVKQRNIGSLAEALVNIASDKTQLKVSQLLNKKPAKNTVNLTKDQQVQLTHALLKRFPHLAAEQLLFQLKQELAHSVKSTVASATVALLKQYAAAVNPGEPLTKLQLKQFKQQLKAIDEQQLTVLKESPAAMFLYGIGMEPTVILGIANAYDNEQQDELSRQLIMKYAGLADLKGDTLTTDVGYLKAQIPNSSLISK
ncbi:hypothetical protein H0A36_19350 [Endozoicomonas sp. SM1973]|uniref:Uncharacterized protein n=1 Tax=Spartinivicinus marinus TaxID=2994442 RepID=A0A853IC92_9GAMM|nr:hypothetical protein [Spartinivicinus marinus]MCX4029338.1 hypothetical protein [Spartinivicinus marinus]NYZ68178.1 hypothetical protein [Spartinivicinus marinus]